MGKLTPTQMMKRAAKQNPAWHPVNLYRVSANDGKTVFQASGELQFDLMEQTYGMIDPTKEAEFTISEAYQGSHLISLLSDVSPNLLALIELSGRFYSVNSLHSADVMGVAMRFDCNSLDDADLPAIRNGA